MDKHLKDCDICTDDINDDLFDENNYSDFDANTSELSDELSAMMKTNNCDSTFNKKEEEKELERLLEEVSEKSCFSSRSRSRSSSHSSKTSRSCKPTTTDKPCHSDANNKTVKKMKKDLYKVLEMMNNIDEDVQNLKTVCKTIKCDKTETKHTNNCDLDDKIYDFIHCQINQKMDSILDTMNQKFEEIEKKISKVYKGISASACRK
jgi:predicted transcriptional regulator